jgi:CRP-like cAMP-binding protein
MAIPGPLRTITLRRTDMPTGPTELSSDRRAQALRGLPLFADLSDDDLRQLAKLSRTRLFAPHEVVVREGDPAGELFVVLRGRLTVSAAPSGKKMVGISTVGPGEIFGEMALLTGAKRSATVRADEECEVVVIGADAFRGLLAGSPELSERVHSLSQERKVNLDKRIDAAPHSEPAEERHFLLRFLEQLMGG